MQGTTIDGYIISVLVFAASVYWVYLAGRTAERRGRNFKTWAWISAVLIGPLALPLLFLLPNLQRGDPEGPKGEKHPDAVKPVIPGNPDRGHVNLSFA